MNLHPHSPDGSQLDFEPNSKLNKLVAIAALAALIAVDLTAQRPGRFGRGRRGGTRTVTPPPPKEAAAKEIENYVAIKGGTVYVGTGQILHNATVLVGDDKIIEVGPGIDIPEKAKIIDATGKFVSPGFVITSARGMGAGNIDDNPGDSVNPFDPQIKMGLAAGITSFLMTSGTGSGTPGGKSAIFKLAYGDLKGMVLDHGTVLQMSVPLTMAQMRSFRTLIKKTDEYQAAKAKFDAAQSARPASGGRGQRGSRRGGQPNRQPSRQPSRPSSTQPSQGAQKPPTKPKGADEILKIREGKVKLWITNRSGRGGGRGGGRRGRRGGGGRGFHNDRIRQALTISELLGAGVVLLDPTTAWSMADEVAATGSMVILNPRENLQPDPANPDTTGSNIAMARILSEVGVPVAVHPPSGRFGGGGIGTGGILGQDLNTPHVDAAFTIRGGMNRRKALRTITLDAARIIGAGSRIGSLEAGKDADILILDGKPLHYRTFVDVALVNGKIVYEKDKEPFYSHIKR